MNRNLFACVGVLLLAAASGCAMCDNSQDCTYGAYGGKWQRHDPCCGRVGSLFDPAGARAMPQQAQMAPSQQPDSARRSVLKPEDGEPLDAPSEDIELLDEPSEDGEPLDEPWQDIELLDEPSEDVDATELPPVEVDGVPSGSEPVEAAPLDLGPLDAAMGIGPENAVPADAEPAGSDTEPSDQLPDFLEELGIKREPIEPLQPLDAGGLPPLVPSPDTDR